MLKDYCDLCPLHRYPSFAQSTKDGKRKLLLPHASWDKKNLGIISRSAAITEQSCKKVVKGLYNELCLDPLLVVPGQASQDGQVLGPAVEPVHQPLFSKLLLVIESPRDINHLADACLVVLDLCCIYSTQFPQQDFSYSLTLVLLMIPSWLVYEKVECTVYDALPKQPV